MATGDDERNFRRFNGPRAIGAILPAIARPAYRRRSPAAAAIMADWPQIVGPALAAVTTPRRLSAETLTLGCVGPVALELQHLETELLARINGHLGRVLVTRLRFVQIAPSKISALPVPRSPRSFVPPATLPEGPVGEALLRLGRAMAEKS
jgi:hypothetical protein